MASPPDRRPADAGASGVPVQPAVEAVPSDWLIEAEHLHLADTVDRLAGDVDLITSLALGGYTGRDWSVFSTELARYGMAVVGGWMRHGLILERCRERGYGGLPSLGPVSLIWPHRDGLIWLHFRHAGNLL